MPGIHTFYKKELLQSSYDAIIIGSGIGGLTTAALLAKSGKKVLVLEQHYMAGGFTHTFRRKGYEWDVGVHYIGEVQKGSSLMRQVFDYISDSELKWAPMPEVYDKAYFGDEAYEFVAGVKNFKEKFYNYFPQERQAIDQYLDLIFKTAKAARGFFMEKAMPSPLNRIGGPFLTKPFLHYAQKTTWEVLSSLTKNQKLIGVLTTQYGDYGLPPKESSFAIHAMVVKHYLEGASYPVGGSSRIAETIVPAIQKRGGQVLVKAAVDQIVTEKGKIKGVRLQNGDEILSPCVISDAGVFNTFERLLAPEASQHCGWPQNIKTVAPSVSHICLYAGLKIPPHSLGIPSSNLWIYPSYDHDANVARYLKNPDEPLPVAYVSFPSAKDPEWETHFPNKSTIEVIGLAPYNWFQKWENTEWRKRGDDYLIFKEKLAQRLLDRLITYVPQVKGKIDYYELSTPLSTRFFANYAQGEIYGLDHTPLRFRQKWLRPNTPIKGLYLTGQDIATDGIGGAMFGGVVTAAQVLKKNILSKITKEARRNFL